MKGVNVKRVVKGVVKAKNCKCCGHHEIGIETDEGEFITFKPGTRIYCVLIDKEGDKNGYQLCIQTK